jgi:hypothetical protein
VSPAVSGTVARPGVTKTLDINVSAPPWLRELPPGKDLPCWEQDPELFFPYSYSLGWQDQIDEAKEICAACPVRDACLEWAIPRTDLEGIWAGTTPMERRRIRTGKGERPFWAEWRTA